MIALSYKNVLCVGPLGVTGDGECTYGDKTYNVGDVFDCDSQCYNCTCNASNNITFDNICSMKCGEDIQDGAEISTDCKQCTCRNGSLDCVWRADSEICNRTCMYKGKRYEPSEVFQDGECGRTCYCYPEYGEAYCTETMCIRKCKYGEGWVDQDAQYVDMDSDRCETCTCKVGGVFHCAETPCPDRCYDDQKYYLWDEIYYKLNPDSDCMKCTCKENNVSDCSTFDCPQCHTKNGHNLTIGQIRNTEDDKGNCTQCTCNFVHGMGEWKCEAKPCQYCYDEVNKKKCLCENFNNDTCKIYTCDKNNTITYDKSTCGCVTFAINLSALLIGLLLSYIF